MPSAGVPDYPSGPSGYQPAYGGPGEKAPYRPFGAAYGNDAPPPNGLQQPHDDNVQGKDKKKNKFGKLGGTMANAAAGGVGFGAGAAIGSGLVNAIF
ncbi:hypothetical protein NLI96_g10650 [Meripilus lineatus]|uniref:Uncharacterized protein n=1 Tax=Meripilus lineatus TaxID=2056292 RepID=A0AAD5UT97_9APHY|nr:hypothetical protein NLI96_g10650 [Physisporinus lineatus]